MSIRENVNTYAMQSLADQHHRFRSWIHCYNFFQSKQIDTDLASLHLGFYLASWGMYRGSGFLLQKDYKIHETTVVEILKPKYLPLSAIVPQEMNTEENIDLLFELISFIKDDYKLKGMVNGFEANVTDTLVTKILLGTLGCIPAYDRFFILGLKSNGLPFSYLNKKNFKQFLEWCICNEDEILKIQSKLSSDGIKYPFMKVADMCFWGCGKEIDERD